jgi:hypothetical protein
LVWKIENYAEPDRGPEDSHRQVEPHDSVILEAPSASQRRSIVCGINQELIVADILARGIAVLAEPAAHPITFISLAVMRN